MLLFILGLILFFSVHSLTMLVPGLRAKLIDTYGIAVWKGVYALMAAVGLSLMVLAYGQLRLDSAMLYRSPLALRHVAILLMLPVFPLVVASYLKGRIRVLLCGHPMLLAIVLWALAHLLVNGRVIDLLLFGSFLLWAVISGYHKVRHATEQAEPVPVSWWGINDVLAVLIGLIVYAAFLGGLHSLLFGVSPI